MQRRYIGKTVWVYWLSSDTQKPPNGHVEIGITSGNYAEDEGMARYFLRKKLGVKRLPSGVYVAPEIGPHG